jgi:hypothetical protein
MEREREVGGDQERREEGRDKWDGRKEGSKER